jgi:signal transduction histidine kinase
MLNQRLGTQIAEAERTLSEVTETPGRNTLGDAERLASVLAQRIESLRDVLGAARQALSEAEQLFVSVQQIQAQAELVKHDLLAIQSRLADLHDMVSLGLTAEALSHELSNVLLQLSERVRTFSQYLKRARIPDSQTIAFSHFVGTSVSALRKQLTHLAPSLRYVREKREAIDLSTACRDLIGYYSGRFERYEGAIEVSLDVAEDFVIWMNRGKLNQIIDNLVLNSEYWLAEELRTKRLDQGEITLRLSRPFLRISDNGRGIDPALERSLFEPFVTGKASGVGRGLGLFIVEQLLEAEGCRIRLDPERNRHGRLHIFEIDFTAALHDPNG